MRSALTALLALVLGPACTLLVACGDDGGGERLIPSARAEALLTELDGLERSMRNDDCESVEAGVAGLQEAVNALPARVDAELRERLQEGVNNLAETAPDRCLEAQTDTTETTETTPTETTETTPTETTETTPPPPPTTPPTETTEPPPPTETTAPTETMPDEGGGAAPPSDSGETGGAEATP